MPRSTSPAGTAAGQSSTPGASPELGSVAGAVLKNGGLGANSMRDVELAELMQEPVGGHNHGRAASTNPEAEGRHLSLEVSDWQAAEIFREGGLTVVTDVPGSDGRGGGWQRAGGTTHRGTLAEGEYVEPELLQIMVERRLGFTYEEIHSVYRQGRMSADQRELRGRIDARLLALSRSGGNMAELGRALGFHVNESGSCEALVNALARARREEQS